MSKQEGGWPALIFQFPVGFSRRSITRTSIGPFAGVAPSAAEVMLNGWFPQATTKNNLRIELGYFAVNVRKTPPPIKIQDINSNYAGLPVSNI